MFTEASRPEVYPFTKGVYPHKPFKPDMEKPAHQKKMQEILKSPLYGWEEKLDGVSIFMIGGRAFTIRDSKATGFPTEKTEQLEHITTYLRERFGPYLMLDGECWKHGLKANHVTSMLNSAPDVAIQKQQERGLLEYHVYDIVRLPDGTWVNQLGFAERRMHLERLMRLIDHEWIILNELHRDMSAAEEAFDKIIAKGGEGIVIKHLLAKYEFGKRPAWQMIKLKASDELDAVIMGFEDATVEYTGKNLEIWPYWENGKPVTRYHAKGWIGNVVIGLYNAAGELEQVGRISGINDNIRADMSTNPEKYIGEVCKVKMMEVNDTGGLRHAFFKGMHPDKNAKDCRKE